MSLSEQVERFNQYLRQGQTLLAIEQFYAEEVVIRENEHVQWTSKQGFWEAEKKNLQKVKALGISIVNQAINESTGVVMTEYSIEFENLQAERYRLNEVSVQQWLGGQIVAERFFYERILKV